MRSAGVPGVRGRSGVIVRKKTRGDKLKMVYHHRRIYLDIIYNGVVLCAAVVVWLGTLGSWHFWPLFSCSLVQLVHKKKP